MHTPASTRPTFSYIQGDFIPQLHPASGGHWGRLRGEVFFVIELLAWLIGVGRVDAASRRTRPDALFGRRATAA